jgi:hypothetical protein
MASSTTRLTPETLKSFRTIIENPSFVKGPIITSGVEQAKPTFNQHSFLVVGTLVVGIVSTIFYYKLNIKSAASFAAMGLTAICMVSRHLSKAKEEKRTVEENRRTLEKKRGVAEEELRVQSIFNDCFKALQTETYFKQRSFMEVFKNISNDTDENQLSEALKLYATFYDSGCQLDDLNRKMFDLNLLTIRKKEAINISLTPTISMENSRQLFPLVEDFLSLNLDTALTSDASRVVRTNLVELRDRCTLFLHGQNYNSDGKYEATFVKLDKSTGTLKIQPWVPVSLPS